MKKSIALALAAAFVLTASVKAGSTAAGPESRINAWTTPHVLTISDATDIDTLNVHLATLATVGSLSEMTMAYLVRWDEHNQPYAELATQVPTQANGGVSADGLTITYHLRKGVAWSDGAPFDADDVAFSTAVVNDQANNEVSRVGWDQIVKVDEPDKFTIVYHLKKPYAPFVATFFSTADGNPCILPKHLLARYSNINHVPYNSLPVGIGPFKFERWDRGKQVVMVANPLYWRGRPKLDKVVFKIVTDRSQLFSQLASHEVDMWYQFAGAYLTRIKKLNEYAVLRQPSYGYSHYDFNLTHRAVSDPVVRKALRLAVNRREIVDEVAHGVGIVQDSATPVNAPYFTDLGTTPYDPAQANALLDRAGWTRGADGIRAKHGVKLVLDAAVIAGAPAADQQMSILTENWKQIGVRLDVHHYSSASFFAPAQQGGIVFGNKWDVIGFIWGADPLGDYSLQYSCNAFPPTGQNNVRWCNPSAQRAMNALYEHFGQSQRNADVGIVMREFVKDVPSIVLSFGEDMYAYNKDLKNYRPNSITLFDNMMNVDI